MSPKNSTSSQYIFTFLRHGESTGNAEERHQGQADFPLTEQGKNQVHKLAAHWKRKGMVFDLAISSPLSRAKQSAEILDQALHLKLEYDPIWMERDNGKLAGLLFEKANKEMPAPDNIPLYQPIGMTGESQWELYQRAGNALNQLMKNPPGRYLIISHGALLNMVIHAAVGLTPKANFQGINFRFSNTGYTKLNYIPGNNTWILKIHNLTSHLDE